MGRIIDVNWVKLHKIGEEFLDQADELNNLEKELIEIFEGVDNGWRGYDASTYKRKSAKVIRALEIEVKYLSTWHSFLTRSSNRYVDNVENGVSNLKSIDNLFEEEDKN